MKIAIIGSYPPRQCGIASFTHDLFKAINLNGSDEHGVIAVSDGSESAFPSEVIQVIDKSDPYSYIQAAHFINHCFDACIIQHEFGIFGGIYGNFVLHLLDLIHIPIVTNLHTVHPRPSADEFRIITRLAFSSSKITVMTARAVQLLEERYQIRKSKMELIPHGTPTFDHTQDSAKAALNLKEKYIMLSFGLLGPGKGFETALESLAHVQQDNFLYIILGQTHPDIIREEGEVYRNSLIQKATELGVQDKVRFVNEFASEELLVQYLTACDLFVTPYPNPNQICSGVLTFAIAAGAAVLSTPYLYAQDLLAEERGITFDFGDSNQLAILINRLLQDPILLAGYRERARLYGKVLSWPQIGQRHLALFADLTVLESSQNSSISKIKSWTNLQDLYNHFRTSTSPTSKR